MMALPACVGALAVLDGRPWLEPLAGVFAPGDRGVAVLDPLITRLFRGGARGLVEFEVHRRAVVSSQPLRWVEDGVADRARRLAVLLERAHTRKPLERVAVAAPQQLWPSIQATLPGDLRGRLAGFIALDLGDATPQEISRAVTPAFENASRPQTSNACTATSHTPDVIISEYESATRLRLGLAAGADRAPLEQPIPFVMGMLPSRLGRRARRARSRLGPISSKQLCLTIDAFRTRFARRRSRGGVSASQRKMNRSGSPADVRSVCAKSSRDGKSTADKWNQ